MFVFCAHKNQWPQYGRISLTTVIKVIVKLRNALRKQHVFVDAEISGLTRLGSSSDQLKLVNHGKAWVSPAWVGLAPLCLAWPGPGQSDSVQIGLAWLSEVSSKGDQERPGEAWDATLLILHGKITHPRIYGGKTNFG